jgi:hypothetical protein
LIIIAQYFDKKRGMATGITMAGSGNVLNSKKIINNKLNQINNIKESTIK